MTRVPEFTVSKLNFVLFNTDLQCLLTNFLTYLPTDLFTYILTYSLHGAESFLRI
jgi:hypothetical protein